MPLIDRDLDISEMTVTIPLYTAERAGYKIVVPGVYNPFFPREEIPFGEDSRATAGGPSAAPSWPINFSSGSISEVSGCLRLDASVTCNNDVRVSTIIFSSADVSCTLGDTASIIGQPTTLIVPGEQYTLASSEVIRGPITITPINIGEIFDSSRVTDFSTHDVTMITAAGETETTDI